MRIVLFCVIGFILCTGANASETAFVYNDNGKRDPFVPLVSVGGTVITYDADMTVGDMNLEGVLSDAKGNSLAIINGKVVKLSDQIGIYKVEMINAESVELSKDQERFTLKLKKGGS